MPTDRPCDQDVVPDSCADNGGLVSVQLSFTVTAGDMSEVWHKNALVFISSMKEFTGAGNAEQAILIKQQSNNIMRDFRECLAGQVSSYLERSGCSASPVSLTQVADCMSNEMAARDCWSDRLGAPPRGIFISQKNTHQSASISANFAYCGGLVPSIASKCVNAPEQSFGKGHVIAHVQYIWRYIDPDGNSQGAPDPSSSQPSQRSSQPSTAFFLAVNLPPRRPWPA